MKNRLITCLLLTLLTLSLCFSFVSCKEDSRAGGADLGNSEISSEIVNSDINRKIIYTVDIGIKSENITETKSSISAKCDALNGYIESNNESYSDGECTFVRTTYRIPTENLDEFIASLENYGGIERKNVETTDITTEYVNAEAKKSSLEERKAALEKLLDDPSTSAGDKVNIINEISEVNAELQSIELIINSYDSKVGYSSVYITINEPDSPWGGIIVFMIFVGAPAIVALIIIIANRRSKKKENK